MDFKSAPAIQEAVKTRAAEGTYGYAVPSEKLKAAIVRNAKDAWGAPDADDRWIRFHPGLIGGLFQAARLAETVIVPTPVYPPFLNAARDTGRMLTINAMDAETVMEQLDDTLASLEGKCVVLWCNPHNPTGRVWRRSELEAFSKVIAKHADKVTAVSSDEVWSGLVLDDAKTPFTSLATVAFSSKEHQPLRDRLIILTSPSKTYNVAALDMAFALIPNDALRRRYFRAGRDQAECTPFGLAAAEAILHGGGSDLRRDILTPSNGACEAWRQNIIAYLRDNRDIAVDFITTNCHDLSVTEVPEASYLLWLDATALRRPGTANLADYLRINYDLALSDGSPFFGKSDSGFLRLNFACTRSLLLEALSRLQAAVTDLAESPGTTAPPPR